MNLSSDLTPKISFSLQPLEVGFPPQVPAYCRRNGLTTSALHCAPTHPKVFSAVRGGGVF